MTQKMGEAVFVHRRWCVPPWPSEHGGQVRLAAGVRKNRSPCGTGVGFGRVSRPVASVPDLVIGYNTDGETICHPQRIP